MPVAGVPHPRRRLAIPDHPSLEDGAVHPFHPLTDPWRRAPHEHLEFVLVEMRWRRVVQAADRLRRTFGGPTASAAPHRTARGSLRAVTSFEPPDLADDATCFAGGQLAQGLADTFTVGLGELIHQLQSPASQPG